MNDVKTSGNQNQLSPEEKRERRFQSLLNPQGITFVSPEAERDYKRRTKREIDFYNIKESDRVPSMVMLGSLPAYEFGIDYRTASYDFEKATEVWNAFNDKYAAGLGAYSAPFVSPGRVLDLFDYKLYSWPGNGLADNAKGYQFLGGEYMKANEYDDFLRDPSGFFLKTYLPRTFGVFEPFRSFRAPVTNVELPMLDYAPFAMPPVQKSFETLIEAGKEYARFMQMVMHFVMKGMSLGYPMIAMTFCKAPFDILGDTLRGYKGIIMDIFRQPDNVLAATDRIADIYIDETIHTANLTGNVAVTFPLHLGADGWMNQKQFDTFYWPSLRKVINALVDEGLVVTLFAEGSYDSRLDSVNEFPRGSVSWMFDKTDMKRAKDILGKDCSICGNIPASLFVTGTPREIKAYCRKLIEDCAPGGGYKLGPGAMADEARMENIQAMVDAAREYGVYA